MIAEILLAHLVGDYLLQSHWMAIEKTKRWWPAVVHGVFYTLPFLFITTEPAALAVIGGTHIVLDRYRVARRLVWLKNWIAPVRIARGTNSRFEVHAYNTPWSISRATGFPPGTPVYLAVWLMIITDNVIHLLINVAAVHLWG